MSDKSKKFEPNAGLVLAVHMNKIAIRALANQMDMFAETLAEALDKTGLQLVPDPFNLTSDAGKVIALEERQKTNGLRVVKEETNEPSGDTPTN